MKPETIEAVGGLMAFLLTVMVFSYLIGDNPLYRIAVHLFVGVAAGFTTVVIIQTVIMPRLVFGLVEAAGKVTADPLPLARLVIPILLSVLLSLKLSAGLAPLSNMAMAFMVGVGAAVAVGGAITGTLFGQISATWINPFKETNVPLALFNAFIIIVGTILTLMYFFYGARTLPGGRIDRPLLLKPLALGGRAFIMVALAALYAGALAATLTVFTERVLSLYAFLIGLPTLPSRLGF